MFPISAVLTRATISGDFAKNASFKLFSPRVTLMWMFCDTQIQKLARGSPQNNDEPFSVDRSLAVGCRLVFTLQSPASGGSASHVLRGGIIASPPGKLEHEDACWSPMEAQTATVPVEPSTMWHWATRYTSVCCTFRVLLNGLKTV
jgi:hypothetical protein